MTSRSVEALGYWLDHRGLRDPEPRARIKNAQCDTVTLLYVFTAWCLIKFWDFALTCSTNVQCSFIL
jgi:hypothetical protein